MLNSIQSSSGPQDTDTRADNHARIESLEILRGLAALGVAWLHFTTVHQENWVRLSGKYGGLGVAMFFVISGFVILMSIHQRYGGFGLRDFAPYMARRLIRLEPPYLAAVAMVIVISEISSRAPGFAGQPPHYELPQVLAHLAYAIPLTPYSWLDPVYWTLAYEFVFYIFAGASFWVLGHPGNLRWLLMVALMIGTSLAGLLPPIALMFALGIAIFRRLFLRPPLWESLAVLGAVTLAIVHLDSPVSAAAGLGTGLAIWATANVRFRGRAWHPLFMLGKLSYSLYLVHGPVGGRVINLFRRFAPDTAWADLVLSLSGLAVSLGVAYLFWRWIEQPAIRLARRVGARLEARNVRPRGS